MHLQVSNPEADRIREAAGEGQQVTSRLFFCPAVDLSARRRFFGTLLLWQVSCHELKHGLIKQGIILQGWDI